MSFSEILAVSKLPGLYQMHKHRADGLIVKSLQDDKVFFAASRAHSFTPLDNITIYTSDEPMELLEVMLKIKEKKSSITLPNPKADPAELKKFFSSVIPNYDEERVYVSDIQKIVKWYNLLAEKDLIKPAESIADAATSSESALESIPEEEKTVEETPVVKPKAKATKKKKTEE
jgi:spore coat protein CotF